MNAAGGIDAGPVEEVERAAELGCGIHARGKREFQFSAEGDRNAGWEGDGGVPGVRFEKHPQRAAGARHEMLIDGDGNCPRRIAVVIAYGQHLSRVQVKASYMSIGPDEIQ